MTMGMTVMGWLRANLLSSPLNAALTAGALLLLFVTVPPLIDWAFVAADFSGETRNDCSRDGACWVFVKMRFWQFVYGFYPAPERWRVDVAFVALAGAVMPLFSERVRRRPRVSAALGLTRRQTLREIIIPQALRIIIPPLTNQYLNLTKNSSLAAAIAYPDLVSVFAGTVLNQTGQAVEVIAVTMAVYLALSLTISALMNLYQWRLARRGG